MKSEAGTSVAVLGLGIIGSRVADCLHRGGLRVRTWSRSARGRSDEVDSACEAVRDVECVCLFLKDRIALRGVVEEIASAMRPGQVLLNHSTVDLATTEWLAGMCAEHEWRFLDAPFTGSKVAAGKGELVYYASGDDDLISEMEPLLSLSSSKIQRCGPIGHATVIKLATNLMSACIVQATSEAMALAIHHGVDPGTWSKAVEANANASPLAMMKIPTILSGDYDPHFSLGNMAKDGRYAAEILGSMGIDAPALAAVLQRMDQLSAEGMAELDYSALAKPYFEAK